MRIVLTSPTTRLLLYILFEIIDSWEVAVTVRRAPRTLHPASPNGTSNVMVVGQQNQESDIGTVLLTRLVTSFSFMLFKDLPVCHSISPQSSGLHYPPPPTVIFEESKPATQITMS